MVGGSNVATNQGVAATQSTTWNGKGAANAIDGDTATFAHTLKGLGEWIEVDLGSSVAADSVDIVNKDCGNSESTAKCLCRLSFANMILMDASNNQLASIPLGNTCAMPTVPTATSCGAPTTVSYYAAMLV